MGNRESGLCREVATKKGLAIVITVDLVKHTPYDQQNYLVILKGLKKTL